MKKRRILVIILVCLLLLSVILLYIPKCAQATLWCSSLDGDAVQVEIDLTYHWRLFTTPFAKGTVTWDGVAYTDEASMLKAFPGTLLNDESPRENIRPNKPNFVYNNTTFYKATVTDLIEATFNRVDLMDCSDWLRFEKIHFMYLDESMMDDDSVSGVSYYGPAKTAEEAKALADYFQKIRLQTFS